jgi:hypothetical protein
MVKHGSVDLAAFEKLSGLTHYVDGDYKDLESLLKGSGGDPFLKRSSLNLSGSAKPACFPTTARALSCDPAGAVRTRRGATGEIWLCRGRPRIR